MNTSNLPATVAAVPEGTWQQQAIQYAKGPVANGLLFGAFSAAAGIAVNVGYAAYHNRKVRKAGGRLPA